VPGDDRDRRSRDIAGVFYPTATVEDQAEIGHEQPGGVAAQLARKRSFASVLLNIKVGTCRSVRGRSIAEG